VRCLGETRWGGVGAFYTTKAGGLEMGLSVSRSVIERYQGERYQGERYQGRLWASANLDHGATFYLALCLALPGMDDPS
jgi:signal transduction histidine kinase